MSKFIQQYQQRLGERHSHCLSRVVRSLYTHYILAHVYNSFILSLHAQYVRVLENQLCESIGRGFDFSLSHRCCGLISSHVTRFIQRIYWGTFVTLISMQFRRVYIYEHEIRRDDFCLLENSNVFMSSWSSVFMI